MKATPLTDQLPAPNLLRHIDPDNHALNAIYITEDVLLHDACDKDRFSFVRRLGGMLKMYGLIQEMANAVSQFECRYERSPWSDLVAADWESTCTSFTTRVINHTLEYEEWPDLHAMLLDIVLPTKPDVSRG